MKIKVEYTIRDGNSHAKYSRIYDLSKPAVYREGFEYKFNNDIVEVQYGVPAMGLKVNVYAA